MVLKSFYIRKDHVVFLNRLPGTMSEHIRRAIDEYIGRIESKNVSASQSKGGGKNE